MEQCQQNDQNISLTIPDDTRSDEIIWCIALEELMCQEAEKCAGLAWLHSRCEIYYSTCHDRLQIPQIILSTIVGAASVGTGALLPNQIGPISIVLGGISIFVSVIGLLDTYYKFAKRTESHRLGSIQYSQIHRMIHIEMSLPRSQRMIPKQLLRYIKYDLKRLMEALPRVPDSILRAYIREVLPFSEDVSHPDITRGIQRISRTYIASDTMKYEQILTIKPIETEHLLTN